MDTLKVTGMWMVDQVIINKSGGVVVVQDTFVTMGGEMSRTSVVIVT